MRSHKLPTKHSYPNNQTLIFLVAAAAILLPPVIMFMLYPGISLPYPMSSIVTLCFIVAAAAFSYHRQTWWWLLLAFGAAHYFTMLGVAPIVPERISEIPLQQAYLVAIPVSEIVFTAGYAFVSWLVGWLVHMGNDAIDGKFD